MSRLAFPILAATAFSVPTQARADDPGPIPLQVIEKMVAAWAETNKAVRALDCQASVESFYPKGSLSAQHNRGPMGKNRVQIAIPAEDTRLKDGACRWALDFPTPRIRKELRATAPHYYQSSKPPELLNEHTIGLFADGKFRSFRPRADNWSPNDRDDKRAHPDAVFYEERGQEFLLSFEDTPLMWAAGSVTGKLLLPSRMKLLEPATAWSYHGEGSLKSHKCFIVSLPNQNDSSSIVEFWVGAEAGFPIYLCRARERKGGAQHWQIEAEYRADGVKPLLAAWTYTQFDLVSQQVVYDRTFRVTGLTLNPEFSPEDFNNQPTPGMTVFSVRDNAVKQVMPNGTLSPYTPSTPSHWHWKWLVGVVSVIAVSSLVLLFRRKRSGRRLA